MNPWLIIIIALSTFAGIIISIFSIVILFFPVNPKTIMGIRLQGVLPRRMGQIIPAVSHVIVDRLHANSSLRKILINSDTFALLLPEIENHIDDFLRHRLGKKMPMIGMFIGENTIRQLKKIFMDELADIFPSIMNGYIDQILTPEQLKGLIAEQFSSISLETVKPVLYPVFSRDLKTIVWLSGLAGLIVGIAQALIVVFVY